MTYAVRRAKLTLIALALVALALAAVAPLSASATSPVPAQAAALKKCKKGLNKKKCRCPKGTKRVKSGTKFRCKKQGTTNGGGGTVNPPPPPPPPPPPAPENPQVNRDDAGFDALLRGSLLKKYEEGSTGYGRYAYNFLSDGQLLFCSYYHAGSTVQADRSGTWQVVEGYTAPAYPGYGIGAVQIKGSDFDVRIGVELYQGKAAVESGNASNVFTEGNFARTIGGATASCPD